MKARRCHVHVRLEAQKPEYNLSFFNKMNSYSERVVTDELFGNHQNVWTTLGDSDGAGKHSLFIESTSLSRIRAFGSSETRKH